MRDQESVAELFLVKGFDEVEHPVPVSLFLHELVVEVSGASEIAFLGLAGTDDGQAVETVHHGDESQALGVVEVKVVNVGVCSLDSLVG